MLKQSNEEEFEAKRRDDIKKYQVEEYKDVSTNLRQYASLRFAQLTLFVATNGALFALGLKPLTEVYSGQRNAIRAMGIAVTAVFWILEERSTSHWENYVDRAKDLENALGFQQYQLRPEAYKLFGIERLRINATNGIRLFLTASFVFWITHWARSW
jgi:hypothetical protein